jgi:NAD(P)-dependent dehydrogenase (short-subunit alcohol dehydrogenase family)
VEIVIKILLSFYRMQRQSREVWGCFAMKQENRVAIVVGGGSGIGRATVKLLAANGIRVVAADIDFDSAKKVVEEVQGSGENCEASAIKVDMTNEDEVKEMVKRTLEKYGRIDILVNVAGGAQGRFIREKPGPFAESKIEEWDRIIDINLKGARNCTRAVVNHMIERGSGKIVNFSSMAGVVGVPNVVDYAAAKAGIIGFTKALAKELFPYGIQVNCISPSGVLSERMQAAIQKRLASGEPLPELLNPARMATPEELAKVVLFLVSEDIKSIAGANIIVDCAKGI